MKKPLRGHHAMGAYTTMWSALPLHTALETYGPPRPFWTTPHNSQVPFLASCSLILPKSHPTHTCKYLICDGLPLVCAQGGTCKGSPWQVQVMHSIRRASNRPRFQRRQGPAGVARPPFLWAPVETGTCRHGVATFPQKAPNYQRILSRTGPLRLPVQAEGAWVG